MIPALVSLILLLVVALTLWLARYRRLTADIDQLIASIDRGTLRQAYDAPASFRTDRVSKLQTALTKILRNRRTDRDYYRDQKQFLADQLADISHQLKTPLTTQALLIHELAQGADLARTLRAFCAQNDRMTRLIMNLLVLARLDADMVTLTPEPVAASDLIADAVKNLEIPLDVHGLTVTREGTPELLITCDRAWTVEALTNLIKNAADVSPDGTTIHVTVTDGPFAHTVSIRDHGPGIATEDIGHIFTRYYKARTQKAESTGIGLAMAQSILARQNATLTAANHPDGGALFTMTFHRQSTL